MYGLVYQNDDVEYWVRRKEKGKSDIVISREMFENVRGKRIKYRVTEYELGHVFSIYCNWPKEVRRVAKELLNKFNENK